MQKYPLGTRVCIHNPQEKDYEWEYDGQWEEYKDKFGTVVGFLSSSEEYNEREAYSILLDGYTISLEFEEDEFLAIS